MGRHLFISLTIIIIIIIIISLLLFLNSSFVCAVSQLHHTQSVLPLQFLYLHFRSDYRSSRSSLASPLPPSYSSAGMTPAPDRPSRFLHFLPPILFISSRLFYSYCYRYPILFICLSVWRPFLLFIIYCAKYIYLSLCLSDLTHTSNFDCTLRKRKI